MSRLFWVVIVVLGTAAAYGQTPEEWSFVSKHDRFKITRSEGRYFLGSEEIVFAPFNDFTTVFHSVIEGECAVGDAKPDLTVKLNRGGETITRLFYVEAKTIGDGTSCGTIGGNGVYYLPLHRTWFTGAEKLTITPGPTLDFQLPDGTQFQIVQRDGDWVSGSKDFFLDWVFFESVLPRLQNFTVHARLHPDVIKTNPLSFTLKTDGAELRFYRVGDNFWAVQLPRVRWLVASKDWSLLQDMGSHLWRDRHFETLQRLAKSDTPLAERLSAASDLSGNWSKAIKLLYQRIVTDPAEPNELRIKIASYLKTKPSDDNFLALARALSQTENRDLQAHISKILRVRNPAAPVIKENSKEDDVNAAIRFWNDWAAKLPKAPK